MTTAPPLDLAAVKARKQATWASGDFAEIATLIVPVAERLSDSADLRAGSTVLDVACGSGNAALAAARLGCIVTGIDYIPALLKRGRERAAAERLGLDLRHGDAEEIPPPPAGLASPMLRGTEEHLAELFGPDVTWVHRRRTFTLRFASAEAFVECFAAYYGPTVKAFEAVGSDRDALERDLHELALTWNRLEPPSPIAVPTTYLESVGVRR